MTDRNPALSRLINDDGLHALTEAAGGIEIHLVGGAIRDVLLGIESPDIDIVVSNEGLRISEIAAALLGGRLVQLGGDRFSAYRIVSNALVLDIWDRQGAPLFKDLERRDFTINAVAIDLESGVLHDPFSGITDLERRRLRMVTTTTFARDPLRVLRLARFALLLPDFSIDPHTRDLARNSAARIDTVAIERTRDELATVLTRGAPRPAIELFADLDLFPRLWNRPDPPVPAFIGLLEQLDRYLQMEGLLTEVTTAPPERLLCVHALVAGALADSTSDSGDPAWPLLTRSQARAVTRLMSARHDDSIDYPRLFLGRWGKLWREASAVHAATTGTNSDALSSSLEALCHLVETEASSVLEPRPLLDGKEIQQLLDLPPGPEIGRIREQLLDAQLRGDVTNREAALEFARRAYERVLPDHST